MTGFILSRLPLARQFATYAFVGAFGTACHYATLLIIVEGLHIHPAIASTAGFLVGAVVNYFLNYKFTFRSKNNHKEAMSKFFAVAGVGILVNGAIMWVGVEGFGLPFFPVQLFATACLLVLSFLINRIWTFGKVS